MQCCFNSCCIHLPQHCFLHSSFPRPAWVKADLLGYKFWENISIQFACVLFYSFYESCEIVEKNKPKKMVGYLESFYIIFLELSPKSNTYISKLGNVQFILNQYISICLAAENAQNLLSCYLGGNL